MITSRNGRLGRLRCAPWKRVPVALCTLLTLVLSGCSLDGSSNTGASAESTSTTTASTTGSLTRMVYIRNHSGANEFVFQPHSITVQAGTRVTWINRSVQPHTVTATGHPPAFDSGTKKLINPKQTYSFVFRHAGKYSYYCLLHPYMTGVVIVRS